MIQLHGEDKKSQMLNSVNQCKKVVSVSLLLNLMVFWAWPGHKFQLITSFQYFNKDGTKKSGRTIPLPSS
jgi:hypothetical protein